MALKGRKDTKMADVIETVNAEELGFTAEDLQGLVDGEGQNADPDAEPTNEPSAEPQGTEPQVATQEPQGAEPSTEPNGNLTEPTKPHGDLNKALAEERARRKALEQQMRELQAQSKPIELPQEEVSNIREFAKRKAAERLGIQDPSELIYTEPEAYEQFVREQAQIEMAIVNEQKAQQAVYQKNVAFVNEVKAIDGFQDLYNLGAEKLNNMSRKDAIPIDMAFGRIDNGVGTDSDFEVVRNFIKTLQDEQQKTVVTPAPLTVAQTLPKAGALNGSTPTPTIISEEDILKAYKDGKEDELPEEIRKQFSEYL